MRADDEDQATPDPTVHPIDPVRVPPPEEPEPEDDE